MKNVICLLFFITLLAACEAGKFTSQRNRLHNMGREKICAQNPARCIDGTNIDW